MKINKISIITLVILSCFIFIPIVNSVNIPINNNFKYVSNDKTYYDVSFSSGGRFKYIFDFFPTIITNLKIEGDHSSMILKKLLLFDYDGIEIEGKDSKITCFYPKKINNPYFDAYTYIDGDSYFGEHNIVIYGFEGKITIREETVSTEISFKNDFFIINGTAEQVIIV